MSLLILLIIMFGRFTDVFRCSRSSLVFYHCLFKFGLNNTVITFLYMFLGAQVQYLCWVDIRSRIAESLVYMGSYLEDNARIVFCMVVPVPSMEYEGSCYSIFSPALGINSLFNFSLSGRCISLIPNKIVLFHKYFGCL